MPPPRKRIKEFGIHSKISYMLILVSSLALMFIGLSHINDTDTFSQNFSRLLVLESVFAITGLLFTDVFYLKKFVPYPKKDTARPLTFITLVVFVTGLFLTEVIQVVSRIPYTISEAEIAFGIIFSAPAEESFFRGFLLSFFSWLSDYFNFKQHVLFRFTDKKTGLETVVGTSGFEVVGGVISALAFAFTHVNYYGDTAMILSLFFMGLLFSFLFITTKDITGLVLAHLFLNIFTVIQFYLFMV